MNTKAFIALLALASSSVFAVEVTFGETVERTCWIKSETHHAKNSNLTLTSYDKNGAAVYTLDTRKIESNRQNSDNHTVSCN
ncbi:hypothetical protein QWZ04_13045 [Vibrio tapetis subsp. quintayensis]|uniref:hypothetical protein n=1 Tax=Vibrio tapetis TaxID=52443 RepID=UPI0025B331CF|nr:hypothetical protein [Vibrio tapetis]MDN3681247.1 hypothetical protein [Vibrio tapetis subsp. quintayensis]